MRLQIFLILVLALTLPGLFCSYADNSNVDGFNIDGSYADEDEEKKVIPIAFLEAEHGEELDRADFVMRYKFLKTTGREWADTDYEEREEFLTSWYEDLDRDKKKGAELTKLEIEQQEEIDAQLEAERLVKEERERARKEGEEQRAMEEAEMKMAFEESIQERKERIEELKRKQRKCHEGECD